MLTRLYNWIKYKTLPPSVNFKNRLFIERDNKQRRIVSNLGWTFRNSKWSDYQRYNVSLSTLTSLKTVPKVLLLLTFFLLLLFSATKYFWAGNTSSSFYTILWFIGDTTVYAKLASLSLLILSFQTWIESQYVAFIKNIFPNSSQRLKSETQRKCSSNFSKSVNKELLYQWALTNSFNNENVLKSLYRNSDHKSFDMRSLLYVDIFNSSRIWSNVKLSTSIPVLNTTDLKLVTSNSFEKLIVGLRRESYYNSDLLSSLSQRPLNTLYDWTLNSVSVEALRDSNLFFVKGIFNSPITSLNDLVINSASEVNKSNVWLYPIMKDQLSWAKTSRWLYKYNILHRRNILTTHKNTLSKRLLGSGFYDTSLTQGNITIQSVKSSNLNWQNLVSFLHKSAYGNFFGNSFSGVNSGLTSSRWIDLNSSNLLSWVEDSLFWASKRFYMFNTLGVNRREQSLTILNMNPVTPSQNSKSLGLNEVVLLSKNISRYSLLSQLLVTRADSAQNNVSNSNLNSIFFKTQLVDLFTSDFSERALLLLQKPYSDTSVYYYYSPLTQSNLLPSSADIFFKKL